MSGLPADPPADLAVPARAGLQPIVVIDGPFPGAGRGAAGPAGRGGTAPRSRPPPRRARSSLAGWWLHHGHADLVGVGARRFRPGRARAWPCPARGSGCPGSPSGSTRRRRSSMVGRVARGRGGARPVRLGRCRKSWASARWCSRCRGGRTGAAAPGSACSARSPRGRTSRRPSGCPARRSSQATVDLWGWRARVRLARGQTIADVTARIPAIESALGTYRGAVRVYPTGDGKANRCELRVLDTDPHAEAVAVAQARPPGRSPSPWTWGRSRTPRTVPGVVPAPARAVRGHDRVGQERRTQRAHGDAGRLRRRGDLGDRPEEGDGTAVPGRRASTGWRPRPRRPPRLLADAVAVVQARAAHLADGRPARVGAGAGYMPALVIIVDEYAELADEAPDAMSGTDSIARLGRALAVTLVAATQRPTQKAMGQGAVRSQMDTRICFRVRERQRRRPGPRPGHAQRRVARAHPQRTRQVPGLRTRAHRAAPRPRLPRHR
jgi:hypothetical protein